ncbi:hypothetical protein ACWDV4_19970 [Micromonospora sp. NPDC003197]
MDSWQRYLAADRGLREAVTRLLAVDYARTLRAALLGGPDFPAAVELLVHHVSTSYVTEHLDVVLPLAIEGGLEQADVRRRLDSVDPAAVRAALPALVGRVLHGTGDQYLEYVGLLDLLAGLGERHLFHAVLAAARAADDEEIQEAAEPYEGERIDPATVVVPPSPPPIDLRRPAELVPQWSAYVAALREQRLAQGAVEETPREEFLPAALCDPGQRDVALRYLAVLVGRGDYQGADVLVRRVLAALPEADRSEVLTALAEGFLDEPSRWRAEGYRSLLWLLGEVADERILRIALKRGRSCPDPRVRIVAETTPG